MRLHSHDELGAMTIMSTETHVIKRIEMMQKELEYLKNKVLRKDSSEVVSLRWKTGDTIPISTPSV